MNLDLRELIVRYGDLIALDRVSAVIRPGRITVVLGPNAAGKSTLLRCLLGAIRPTAGAVLLDGQPTHRIAARQLAQRMAFVPQRAASMAGYTVREVVEIGRYALPRDAERVEQALERMGLQSLADRAIHTLSVGQQQRVTLARALAQLEPGGCLVLDEPTSAMDLRHARAACRVLREMAEGGATVIVALHDLLAACLLADEALLLHEGRLAAHAPAEAVLEPARLEHIYGVPFVEVPVGEVGRTLVPRDFIREAPRATAD